MCDIQQNSSCPSLGQAGAALTGRHSLGTGPWGSPPSLPALARPRGTCTVPAWGLPRLWHHVGVQKFVEAETKPRNNSCTSEWAIADLPWGSGSHLSSSICFCLQCWFTALKPNSHHRLFASSLLCCVFSELLPLPEHSLHHTQPHRRCRTFRSSPQVGGLLWKTRKLLRVINISKTIWWGHVCSLQREIMCFHTKVNIAINLLPSLPVPLISQQPQVQNHPEHQGHLLSGLREGITMYTVTSQPPPSTSTLP